MAWKFSTVVTTLFCKVARHTQRILPLVQDFSHCWSVGDGDCGRNKLAELVFVGVFEVAAIGRAEDWFGDVAMDLFGDSLGDTFLGVDHRLDDKVLAIIVVINLEN